MTGLSRRQLLRASGVGALTVVAPQSAAQALAATRPDRAKLLRGGAFAEGVLSGDPTPHGITLLARMTDVEAAGKVLLEVATDPGFRKVVAHRRISTSAAIGHNVKARVKGLRAGERYWYRFSGRTAESRVGRFQTAYPRDSREPVRFAFFSCQELSFGYYNAHKLLAREDVDFVINLGDYIYGDLALPTGLGVRRLPRLPGDRIAAVTLADYDQRYQDYRADADLRAMHAKLPMISCWDDHEVQNDYAGADPAGGVTTPAIGTSPQGALALGAGPPYTYTTARRAAAYRAFFRNMPTFAIGPSRLYHRAAFGRHMDLFVLDERQYRARQPCGDAVGPACAELPADRAFLGRRQNAFLRSGLDRSKATWKVIANEVVIQGLKVDEQTYETFDGWQGYPAEREALLESIRRNRVEDVVFVTGDWHAFIAGDVRTAQGTGAPVATEFVGGSITSPGTPETNTLLGIPGYGTLDAPSIPAAEMATRRAANPYSKELDYVSHGYVVCEAGSKTFKATYKKLETVRRRTTALRSSKTYTVHRGTPGL